MSSGLSDETVAREGEDSGEAEGEGEGEAFGEGEDLDGGEALDEDEDEEETLDGGEALDGEEDLGEGDAFAESEDSDSFDCPRAAPITMPIAITAFAQNARARDRIQSIPGWRLRAFCEYIRDNTQWNRWN
ncbi:MAG: hypothetical protein WCD63_16435, partial [Terrimicrobiaceae bacterium]